MKLTVLTLVLGLSACVPHAPLGDIGKNGPSLLLNGQKVGRVQVNVDLFAIAWPYRKTLEMYDVTGRIRSGVIALLQKQDSYDDGSDLLLHINIADFSLRSDLSALVYGLAIEADKMVLNVRATKNGVSVRGYTIQSIYRQGGLMAVRNAWTSLSLRPVSESSGGYEVAALFIPQIRLRSALLQPRQCDSRHPPAFPG